MPIKMLLVFFVAAIQWVTFFSEANAGHILEGQITAEAVSGQHFTYQIKFILYTDNASTERIASAFLHFCQKITSISPCKTL